MLVLFLMVYISVYVLYYNAVSIPYYNVTRKDGWWVMNWKEMAMA
jgi:hypothetical protein